MTDTDDDTAELDDEPPAPQTTETLNVNGEVIDEALVNSWVVEVQYVNPADPDGPEGPLEPPADEEPAEG